MFYIGDSFSKLQNGSRVNIGIFSSEVPHPELDRPSFILSKRDKYLQGYLARNTKTKCEI